MTKEQETLKYLSAMRVVDFNKLGFVYGKETIDEVLTLIQQLQEENKQKDKMIDEMLQEFTDCEFELKCSNCNCECEKDYDQLYTCNKQYFKKKASEE